MRVAVLGRTEHLLKAAMLLCELGHVIRLVWTCPSESYYSAGEDEFQALANTLGADYRCDININKRESVDFLKALDCDISISVNWMTVITAPVISCFKHGILNAHAGDLPRYRGNACINWAILNDELHVGLCIHQMVPELDAGPIILRDRFPLHPASYVGDVHDLMKRRIPEMFVVSVEGLAQGTLTPQPQPTDPDLFLRSYPRRPEDSRIDWAWPVHAVHRMIRASSRPFSGAFAYLEDERRVTIWRAEPVQHRGAFLAVPGQVCYRMDNDPVICCGDGMLRLTDIEVEGAPTPDTAKKHVHKSLRNRLR